MNEITCKGSPLSIAICSGRRYMVDKLLDKGVDISVLDGNSNWLDGDPSLVSLL